MAYRIAVVPGHDPWHQGAAGCDHTEYEVASRIVNPLYTNTDQEVNYVGWLPPRQHAYKYSAFSAGSVLKDKVSIINEAEPELAIETHLNWHSTPKPNGFEVIYVSNSGKKLAEFITLEYLKQMLLLEEANFRYEPFIHNACKRHVFNPLRFRRVINMKSLGRYLYFLAHTTMPAVIFEIGFITNVNDMHFLTWHHGEEAVRKAIKFGSTLFLKNKLRDASTYVSMQHKDSLYRIAAQRMKLKVFDSGIY